MSYLQGKSSSPGPSSIMASRNKNIPFSKGIHSQGIPARPAWKGVSSSEQTLAQETQVLHRKQYMDLHNGPSRHNIDHRTYNDPTQVRKWVVTSASGSQYPAEDTFQYPCDGQDSAASYATHLPDYSNNFQSAVSEFSLSSHVRMYEFPDSRTSMDPVCTAATSDATIPIMGTSFHLDPGYIENDYSFEENHNGNAWTTESHTLPGSSEMVYSTSAGLHQKFSLDFTEGLQFDSYWREPQISRPEIPCDGHVPCTSSQVPISPLSAVPMDPSVSSYSQNSLFPLHNGSPGSSSAQEDLPSLDTHGIPGDEYMTTLMDGAVNFTSSCDFDTQSDLTSTLRPSGFHQGALSNLTVWPSSDASSYPSMVTSYGDGYPQRRMSGDGDNPTARHHELYSIGVQEDGLYHCPFEAKDRCTHKAEKLKCNYDKHLDSHLKPYRCKVHSCVSVPFSSTACLLRHEREAHGMHGHGEKPYLCTYEDCDRSTPGNGFPRRWNLQDHMKRVHDFTAPPSSNGSTSPTPSSVSSQHHGKANLVLRKRRTSANSQTPAPKRTKSTAGTKPNPKGPKTGPSSQPPGKQKQSVQKQWREQHAALKERIDTLVPSDEVGHQQIGADYALLDSIRLNLCRIEAGQLANH